MEFLGRLQKYRTFKVGYSDAGTAYRNTVERIDWYGDFMGINLFWREFKVFNYKFIWGLISLALYVYVVFESTYYYRHNVEQALSCLTTFGFSTQMASKIYTFIIRRKRVIEVNEANYNYFDSWIARNTTVQRALKPSVLLTHILLTLTIYGYIVLVGIIGLAPMVYGLITSNKVLSFGFEISHSDSWTVYIINGLFQANCAYYVAFLTIITDGAFILYLLTATGQVDAILELLTELNRMMKILDNNEEINQQLINVIHLHQRHLQYMREVEGLFNVYFLISIASLCFNMSISLAAFVLINWYIGLVVFCFASSQIFYMCFLGTYMETKSEHLMLGIGAFDWYKLSVSNQKKVKLILEAAQNPIALTAVMEELNMAAYLKIHKTVYSGLMLLLRMKD